MSQHARTHESPPTRGGRRTSISNVILRGAALAVLALSCAKPVPRAEPVPAPAPPPADTTTVVATPPAASPAPTTTDVPLDPPPLVAREFRAAWVSPIWASGTRDWPSRPGLPDAVQQAEMRALLDRARALGLNAVVLHVRMAGDAIYPSSYAPWTPMLSGAGGVGPSYDPLAFAVAEAHARGLQLHAWFNPFRARIAGSSLSHGASHVTRVHPDWIRTYGTQTWIDPGEPAARRHVLESIIDVVRRYDVDGVHIDDYFYPYREQTRVIRVTKGRRGRVTRDIPFPDERTWRRYGASRFASRDDWRRNNIDTFVEAMYREVKAVRPSVLVGISPFGIWRSGVPAGVTGLDAYGEIYADARKWLAQGWMDYMAPQLYWELRGEQSRFRRLDAWWRTQNPHGRLIYPGLHTARAVIGRTPWRQAEIPDQIDAIRVSREGSADAPGHVHFRLASLRDESSTMVRLLRDEVYAAPALPPAAPWLGGAPPAAPRLTLDGRQLLVSPGDATPVRWWLVQTLQRGQWTTELRPAAAARVALAPDTGPAQVHVTAIDAAGQTSAPVGMAVRR